MKMNVFAAARDTFEDIRSTERSMGDSYPDQASTLGNKFPGSDFCQDGYFLTASVMDAPHTTARTIQFNPKVVFCPIYDSQDVHTKDGSPKDSGIKGHSITKAVNVGILSPSNSTETSSRTADVSLDCNELAAS